ncbi:Na+/H+ antiporter NhaC [Tepidanaerobacter acetatoxydans Re1]|uniref:Na+/H+ antiporter NhaC n=1 Tax=Tepidanaerobacter acetatoxydans (strain DSM 21804 / JCM 16047 / Re1) TaxID=1209989 RepID=F4LQK1_TEPAE|nr:Na+/H+ antiporter NhaC [Tepidanaerobacter acetatoxydans]AEE92004.1 Na+/H+ antiporter NhaC [Tepidanaerobacter acetatoxydans Re1]CCP26843.1 Na+/H+ antiporter NhaC [Tepidanaerobacter acetatoxydans Re1]
MSTERKRRPTIGEAVIAMILVIVLILISIRTALVLETALVFGAAAAALIAMYLGYSWEDIEQGMLDGIRNGLGACIILIVIGMVVGTWILGGTIQTMIYYGLKLLTPQIFLPVGFMLCSLTSLLIGSSFGTIATMGIVLMGVAEGLSIPRAITAGAIVCGAMFGDKVSPLSDSTNLTAAMTGTKLFDHVRSMLYVSGPGAIICLLIYTLIGRNYAVAGNVDFGTVESILTTLSSNFNLSIMTLIPPAIVIILSVLKLPAIAALMISFISAGALSIFTQGASLAGIIEVGANGFISNTGHELIDKLLTQGGINSMMSTVAIIMAGTAMGGILEKCGILQVLLENLMKHIKKPRDLILASLAGAYLMLLATGEMMVSIIVPGRTLEPAFHEMKIHTSVLSRTLETGATLMCGALPWGVASVYAQNVLNVGFEYIPYCYLPFIAPIIAIIYAFVGFATFPAEPEVDS